MIVIAILVVFYMIEYSTMAPLVKLRTIASKSTDRRLKMVD